LAISGGREPYTFYWNDGATNQMNRFNLESGDYKVNIADQNGCTKFSDTIRVKQPEQLSLSLKEVRTASCSKASDGGITLNIVGGIQPYEIIWSNGIKNQIKVDTLISGPYTVRVTDLNNCKYTLSGIQVPHTNTSSSLTFSLQNLNKCHNDELAVIKAQISKGVPPLSYNWSIGKETIKSSLKDTLSGLGAGNYQLTVTDNQGCISVSEVINIPLISLLSFTYSIKPNDCQYDSIGSIILKPINGTKPYEFLWNTNITSDTLKFLKNGIYSCTITDSTGCQTFTQSIPIFSKSNLSFDFSVKNESSSNSYDGSIILIPILGLSPYKIKWADGSTLFQRENLKAGQYPFYIEDNLMCTVNDTISIGIGTSTQEQKNRYFTVSPNPFFDRLLIESNLGSLFDAHLYNSNGQKIMSTHNAFSTHYFETLQIGPGLYFLHIISDKVQAMYKVLKN
jgi:hypothetical protein